MRLTLGLLLTLAVWSSTSGASAEMLYATSFESPPFQAGQPLVGQDGWQNQVFDGNALGPNAFISLEHPSQGLQSFQVDGDELTPTGFDYAVGSYRKFVNYDLAAASFPTIRLRVDMRLDGPPTDPTPDNVLGDFVSANLVGFTDDGAVGELFLSSDGHIYGVSAGGAYLFAKPTEMGRYYRVGMDYDFTARTASYFIDGELLGVEPLDPNNLSTNFSRGSLLSLALDPDPLSRDRSAYTAYFDNFSIQAVPEPATIGLAIAGGLVAWLARKVMRRVRE